MLDELAGRRVALRHRIAPDRAPGPHFSDAVGELAPDGPEDVIVHTRRGSVRVARDAVVAVREVPPAPPRRASRAAVARLERFRSDAWPAPDQQELGGWLLRAAGGFTLRANSALATGDPGMPVERALARVREFAAEHRIAPLVQTPVGSPWSNRILDAGWRVRTDPGECVVLVTPVPDDGLAAPDWPSAPPERWWAVFGGPVPAPDAPALRVLAPGAAVMRPGTQSKGPPGRPSAALRPGEQSKGSPWTGFGVLDSADGEPAAAVRAAVLDGRVHLARLHVAPTHRRRGSADRITREALAWGRARGARHAVLDVAAGNAAARALYARAGWTEHHRYHYLVPG